MAITNYYVDPAINADSGTGTIGDPWGDLQYALNNITRNSTDGDQINIKAGTAEVLTATLSLSTYGTPSQEAPLIVRGYTSAAGDGGQGDVNGNAGGFSIISSVSNVFFIDMKLRNTGGAVILNLASNCGVIQCEVSHATGNNNAITGGVGCAVVGCYIHDVVSCAVAFSGAGLVYGCFIKDCGTNGLPNIVLNSTGCTCCFNILVNARLGIQANLGFCFIFNNSISAYSASTATGIRCMSSLSDRAGRLIFNNIVQGYSGAGGVGIEVSARSETVIAANALHNNTTNISSGPVKVEFNNDNLGASPFVDAANGDFDINGTVTGVTEDAWPQSWPGLTTSTSPKPDKGAVQAGAGAGSGGMPMIGSPLIRGEI